MKKIFFLSGLQRSGSTLLTCLLNQNRDIYSTPTSPLFNILSECGKTIDNCYTQFTFDKEDVTSNLVSGLLSSYYKNLSKKYIIDKNRGWVHSIDMLKKYNISPKIVCTIRPIPEIISSFITLIKKSKNQYNVVDKELRLLNQQINITNRSNLIFERIIDIHRKSIIENLEKNKENIHIITYDNLAFNTKETMESIYNFLDIPNYKHNFNQITNNFIEEKDLEWGFENLHSVRGQIKKISTPPEEVLGKELTEYYSQFDIKYS